jgi:hypothetical protein
LISSSYPIFTQPLTKQDVDILFWGCYAKQDLIVLFS